MTRHLFPLRLRQVLAARAESSLNYSSSATVAEVKTKRFNEIPGPVCLPFIGTMWEMLPIIGNRPDLSRRHVNLMEGIEKYGPVFKVRIPFMGDMVILSEPEDFETMRWYEEKYPSRKILGPLEHYRTKISKHNFPHAGVLIVNGEDWYRMRAKYQQRMMKPKSALKYLDVMQSVASDFIDRIRLIRDANNEAPEDFQNDLYRWALESVSCFALNARLGCLQEGLTPDSDAQKMITAMNITFDALNYTENNLPLWKIYRTKQFKRLIEAQEVFTEISLKYIRRTLEIFEKDPVTDENEASILQLLLTKDNLSQNDVLLLILDLLMAGIDTTSHSMGFLLFQLAKNPDKQLKLREEVDQVIGDKSRPVTAAALNSLSYLKSCIRESMRMQSVAGGILREFGKDVVIHNYMIPKGTKVFAFAHAAGQNPKYFQNPREFRPERWIRGIREDIHPYATIPFGHGLRMCLGRRFAEQEMWLLTAKLIQNFDVKYHYEDIDIRSRLLMIPDKPLKFQFNDSLRHSSSDVATDSKPKSFNEIPGPVNVPLLGSTWKFLPIVLITLYASHFFVCKGKKPDPSRMYQIFFDELASYGPIYKWRIPFVGNIVVLSEPQDFEDMRWHEEKYPTRKILRPIERYRMKVSKHKFPHAGVLIINGPDWYRLRTKYQQRMLKPKSALQYLNSMQDVATDFIARVRLIRDEKNEMPEDFQNELYKWALESVSCFALNTRLGCLDAVLSHDSDAQKMITATNETFDALNITENGAPFWMFFPSRAYNRLIKAQDTFTEIALKYIRKVLEDVQKNPDTDEQDASVLQLFLSKDELTQDDVLLLILDLLMAGIDTTSHSMGFLLYHLAKNPEKQAKLRAEVDEVVGGKSEAITAKALNSLSYLKACIKESMRLLPVTSGILREFNKDVIIRNYLIPKGTWVVAATLAASRDSKYFSDPDEFKPERWMRGTREDIHPYATIPFGHGLRMCLGRRFAEQEMWLLTAKLIQNFEIQYHYEDIGIKTRLLNIPDQPLRFQLIDR
ncbi:unnamed protein product [Notodromas monacha]|uniref:Cytochrome P450 n=1 Tax=Notodromas monacha TaxID=399045 RepID=A0A7R9BFG6_9CRUS|nr:unnamed protein product [Notodromas monacha]CAG0914444.1 unnamed protein product [Notodromas monacha]